VSERRSLAADFGATVRISDERVDAAEVAQIVREAAAARNGWKVILARCASLEGCAEARQRATQHPSGQFRERT
jgi:hypothetical protein